MPKSTAAPTPLPSPQPGNVMKTTTAMFDYLSRHTREEQLRIIGAVASLFGMEVYEVPEGEPTRAQR
jgi:hypothetical protein